MIAGYVDSLALLAETERHIDAVSDMDLHATGDSAAIERGILLSNAGRHQRAISLLESRTSHTDFEEPKLVAKGVLALAFSFYSLRRMTDLKNLVHVHEHSLSPENLARIHLKEAWAFHLAGSDEDSDLAYSKAADTCSLESSQLVLAESMYFEGYRILSRSGVIEDAERRIDLACSLFRYHSENLLLAHALVARANIHWSLGHPGFADSLATEALALAAELGNHRTAMIALRQLAIQKYGQGLYETALALLESCKMSLSTDEEAPSVSSLRTDLARVRVKLHVGNSWDAMRALSDVKEHEHVLDVVSRALSHEYRALAHAQLLDYEKAFAEFGEARKCLRKSNTRTYELAEVYWQEAEVHLAMHNPRLAMDLADKAIKIVEECGNYREYGQILRVKATALTMLARGEDAIPLFQEAVDELRRRNNQFELALTLTRLAEALEQDASAAAEAANEAVAIFNRLGLPDRASEAHHALDVARLRVQASQRAEERERTAPTEGKVVAEAQAMQELLADCRLIAQSHAAVVITGETGVGKEVVARYIHDHSPHAQGPFVPVNCAALPESLFEREFFGHKKGAFTGAERDTPGLVNASNGGTLFLDEIGELPLPMQAKLLRLLQEHTYRRVGDVKELRADIRILAATNHDLKVQVDAKTFREDLWYRLNAFQVHIPPLHERPEDIAALTDLFLERESERMGIEFWMDRETRQLFGRYAWPGNVRELEAAVSAGTARAVEDGCVRIEHLPLDIRRSKGTKPTALLSLSKHLEIEERRLILHALRRCHNSRAEAARYLGIGRNTLYEKMQRLGISLDKEARG